MRLLVITSGLEPGGDGVGDYCYRLAGALQRSGHEVAMLALNDRKVEPDSNPGLVSAAPVFRLSARESWGRRRLLAREWLADFQPDALSLHFVCYGFHGRGWVGGLANSFKDLLHGRKLHLMMHELWVMWGMKCRIADRITGMVQRQGVRRVIRVLRPDRIDTTLPFYQAVLGKNGVECGLLPLCGNFAPVMSDARDWLGVRLHLAGLSGLWPRTRPLFVAGFFGTIFGHWNPISLLCRLTAEVRRRGCELMLLSGGKASSEGERLFDGIPDQFEEVKISKLRLGALSVEQASQYLNTLDLGLSCYSKLFIGKSSAAATMLDHGLTVVAGGSDPQLEKAWNIDPQIPGVLGLNDPWPATFDRRLACDSAKKVAELFLARLTGISV